MKNEAPFLQELKTALLALSPMAVAFSGGLDSRFLCHAAQKSGCDVLAIHATGPHIPPKESEWARTWAKGHNLAYIEIEANPLALPEAQVNSINRCYACKRSLLELVKAKLAAMDEQARTLCDGGNFDDLKVFRPGQDAARELGVISPLARLGLGKAEIRQLGRALGLDHVEQKAGPCLLTRLDYGMRPSPEILKSLAHAEEMIADALAAHGLPACDFRLRLAPDPVLHLLPGAEAIYGELKKTLEDAGFSGCGIETVESLSGFFDRKLAKSSARPESAFFSRSAARKFSITVSRGF